MNYCGSKRLIAKPIIDKILSFQACKNKTTFYDIFCGGGNLVQQVPPRFKRIAIDKNKYVIACLKQIQKDPSIFPDRVSRIKYIRIWNNKEKYDPALVGFVGICCSYFALFFNGYIAPDMNRNGNKALEGKRNAIKQSAFIQNIDFLIAEYDKYNYEKDAILYFDPPYKKPTVKYGEAFNYEKFWEFIRTKSKNGFLCFVSEQQAPIDFYPVMSFPLNTGTKKKRDEFLFIHESLKKELL